MSCLDSVKYKDFRLALQERLQRPLHAEYELTHRCNLSCAHCYLGSWRELQVEQPAESVKVIIEKLEDAGFLWLIFTGGEPLVRPDFCEIYRYAKERGFIIIVLTNATLIDEHMADFFATHRPFYLDISVHAVKKEIYERISGVRGSFFLFSRAISLLRKRGIPFKLKTKVMKENSAHLSKISEFAKQLDVPHNVSSLIHSCLDGDTAPLAHSFDSVKTVPGVSHSSPCAAVNFSVCIDPAGKLMACACARTPAYDLSSGEVLAGVQFLKQQARYRKCIVS